MTLGKWHKIRFVLISLFFLVVSLCNTSCRFWVSHPPDFSRDKWKELNVIWDVPHGVDEVVHTVWITTNDVYLSQLSGKLDMTTWRSLSILANSHPTRILILTQSGRRWEIHLFGYNWPAERGKLSMFSVDDLGISGTISSTNGFFGDLGKIMTKELQEPIDLTADYSGAVYRGEKRMLVPESTKKSLAKFFVYGATQRSSSIKTEMHYGDEFTGENTPKENSTITGYTATTNEQLHNPTNPIPLTETLAVTQKEALSLAEQYVAKEKIDVSRHSLESVRLVNINGERQWVVTWVLKKPSDGGQVFISVKMDRSVSMIGGL